MGEDKSDQRKIGVRAGSFYDYRNGPIFPGCQTKITYYSRDSSNLSVLEENPRSRNAVTMPGPETWKDPPWGSK